MDWLKKGIIQNKEINIPWSKGRAIVPIPQLLTNNILRIYFSTLDEKGRSQPVFIETDVESPNEIKYSEKSPILALGNLGSFDDSGITVSSIVKNGNRKHLYYIGWNPQKNVSYKLAIGLAISEDDGLFKKISEGPIMDRSIDEPYFNTAPSGQNVYGSLSMKYSCTTPQHSGTGNVDGDPQYIGRETNNYRLAFGSPCINSGTNLPWMTGAKDLDGNDRTRESWGFLKNEGNKFVIFTYRNCSPQELQTILEIIMEAQNVEYGS